YVTKPFSLRELKLRIGALLRRTARGPVGSSLLVSGTIEVDTEAHTCRVDGEPCDLTVLELKLLTAFLRAPGRAQTRTELRTSAWGSSYRIGERAVDTNIKRLRKKLGEAGDAIETVRGVGYRWGG
ncbi:MAG: response regulator transcription factor, partial [Myxococcales bacterium]|nr:response regulator transcription factor [Myxococcales bacterium]